ncbi:MULTISPECIES: hypothetical protein [Spiroplasma]|uniref:hypothetical protein n=1 Tax=Spiroplasma TaxID=2132 RepID=UPI0018DCB87C|nr:MULTISPECIES: hypothetical protein [Spiroplasma]MBH8623273.1 hypothetical protein [Spiroplasma sp. hyd1]UNF61931.1 hypothetical protein MNU24_00220 [Spiroplasma poulsonii]
MTITEWIKYEKLEKENQVLKNQLAEKDKEYGILLSDRDKLEMYRHNQLKKSDITLHYIECNECESEEFCDDNNLFKVVNEFEHDENCSDYGNILNLDIRCIIKYKKYESLEE